MQINQFPILTAADDDDLLLIESEGLTYKVKLSTLKTYMGIEAPPPVPDTAILLCNFNGANNSTVFTDLKGHSLTGYGAKISTAQSKVGDSSLYLDGYSHLSILNSTDFDFGGGDFTIAFWYYDAGVTQYSSIFNRDGGDYPWSIYSASYNGLVSFSAGSNSAWVMSDLVAGSRKPNTWTHYAFTRSGDSWLVFEDGILKNTKTASGAISAGTNDLVIGNNSGYRVSGYMNRLEIHKAAIYTQNFTPSTSPLTL